MKTLLLSIAFFLSTFLGFAQTPYADIVTTITNNQTEYLVNETTTYLVTVTNQGPNDALNVVVNSPVPAGLNAAQMSWTSSTGASGDGALSEIIPTLTNGQVLTYNIMILIPNNYTGNLVCSVGVTSSTTDYDTNNNFDSDVDLPRPDFVTVDSSTYTTTQLIKDVLINEPCVQLSAFTSSAAASFGAFKRNNSNFPFKEGIIIRTGTATATQGKFNNTNISTVGTGQGDPDLNLINGNNSSNDRSFVKFNFVPTVQTFSFNFLFASNEYGTFQCSYGDTFAFILTNLTTGVSRNLAVVPGSVTPATPNGTRVSVITIRDAAYNGGCGSVNPQYFARFNQTGTGPNAGPASSAINMIGQTVPMTAQAEVTPGTEYSIKLVIADHQDTAYDSAVFLEAGSFTIGGPRITGTGIFVDGTDFSGADAFCEGTPQKIQAGTGPVAGVTYSWLKDGVEIVGANSYNLQVTEPGIYTVIFSYGNGCQQSDDVVIEFKPIDFALMEEAQDLYVCATATPSYNLTLNEPIVIAAYDPTEFDVFYYTSLAAAQDPEGVAIPASQVTNYPGTEGQEIWMKMVNIFTGGNCDPIKSFKLFLTDAPSGTMSYPDDGGDLGFCIGSNTNLLPTAPDLTLGGVYSAEPAGLGIDPATGGINLSNSAAGTYTVTYTFNSPGCDPFSTTTEVIVLNCLITTASNSGDVCADIATFNLFATDAGAGATYEWTDAAGTVISTVQNPVGVPVPTVPGSYSYTVIAYLDGAQSPPSSTTIIVSPIVVITAQPVGATKCIGESITFSTTATGNDLTYQWFFNGTAIPAATNASYIVAPLTAANDGSYTVEVSGSCGTPVLSDPAVLILTEETIITVPPVVSQTVCEGDAVTINVTATGTDLTYQWFKGTAAVAGATTSTLTIAAATPADAGTYTCVITNPCQVVTTTTSELIVNTLPKITTQPVGTTVCEGEGITLSVVATGTTVIYQWFKDGVAIAGATAASYTDATATLASAGSYTVTVTGACNPAVTSAPAVVIVNQNAAFTQQPEPSTIVCSGTEIILTVATTGGTNVTYQWFKGATPIAGATAPTYTIANSTVADSGNYTCKVTVVSCGTITSEVAVVVVNQAPVITSQPKSKEICVGQSYTFEVVATGTNLTYQWYKGTTEIVGATANTYSITNATQADSGDFYCIITSESCPNIQTSTVTLLVKPLPFATIAQGDPSTICAGESTQVIFNGTAGAVVMYTINGGTPETITLNAGVPTILPTGILNTTTVYELASVTYTGADACSQNLTGSATITVNPIPKVKLEDGKICVDPITFATTRNYLLNTGLNEAQFTFEWFDLNGTIPLATNSFYDVSVVGQYGVTITDIVTGCQATAYATVGQSSPPIDFDYTVTGFFANNPTVVITATPAGNYEYSLDYGPFQESNVFDNISAGTHTITVRDPEACDVLTKEVLIVDYPRYFTPNGDGINDTWNIPSINGISFTKIYIFDRFGKLLKEMTTSGLGWDGIYNGKALPASDYWFTLNYQEDGINKEFRAHFSLKR